ncbi:multimeric flavodoxin WrbA [Methanolinea mesophila]|uniref:flavodoxin family protein n=1 Tax=Methanolinea mesophila TaxID=547055 RepID=UPI001AE368A6|nr:flavodoxin family protein [Methanolinea mesophila]MBP1927590.1 multimeric flavodoxin WrbA [Methanolinea mesophila]
MAGKEHLIRQEIILTNEGEFVLTLAEEDLSSVYPRLKRYTLTLEKKGDILAVFRTNTYEYSPLDPLKAKAALDRKAEIWSESLRGDTREFLSGIVQRRSTPPPAGAEPEVVIIQGSPRGDGNSSIMAAWAMEEASGLERTVKVIYPHDMAISPCIGCYQCYNTGTCTFADEMAETIDDVRKCRLLVVCTPVYTNTVPGGLKVLIDRFQAYHAERTIAPHEDGRPTYGVLLAVAGRNGQENFTCVQKVIGPFMRNIGIEPRGEILVDGTDELGDIRRVPGLKDRVKVLIRGLI